MRPCAGQPPALPEADYVRLSFCTIICAIVFTLISVHPAFAVRVWNIGTNFEQPPGTPQGSPQRISTGVRPDPLFLQGQRHIKIRVVAAGSGKPIENAAAYLVRLPHEDETVVYSTDRDGRTIIWNIEDCYRKLVVTDGTVAVRQWLPLPPGCEKDIVVKLPYKSLITVTRPKIKCNQVHFYAFQKHEGEYGSTYKGWVCCDLMKIWLPGGSYQLMMDACDKNDNLIKRHVWDEIKVADGKSLFVKAKPHVEMAKPFAVGRFGLSNSKFVKSPHSGKPYLRNYTY